MNGLSRFCVKFKYQVSKKCGTSKNKNPKGRRITPLVGGETFWGPYDKADYNKSASANCQYGVRGVLDLRHVDKFALDQLTERDNFAWRDSLFRCHLKQGKTPAALQFIRKSTRLGENMEMNVPKMLHLR